MTDKEIQASDEEMEQFNVSQNEKCVSAKEEKLNDLMNKISFALKDATLTQGFEIICKRISDLEKENERMKGILLRNDETIKTLNDIKNQKCIEIEELKKNALVWHKVTCFDKPDENGFITNDAPAYDNREYLVRTKRGHYSIQELMEVDTGVVFEDYEWEDVDAWAELPEV